MLWSFEILDIELRSELSLGIQFHLPGHLILLLLSHSVEDAVQALSVFSHDLTGFKALDPNLNDHQAYQIELLFCGVTTTAGNASFARLTAR